MNCNQSRWSSLACQLPVLLVLLVLIVLFAAPTSLICAQSASFAAGSTIVASGLKNAGNVSTDPYGNAFVTDFNNGTITEIYTNGETPRVVVSGLASPIGVAPDANGNLYVGEYYMRNELKIAADGTRSVLATDIVGTSSTLDTNGNLFVTNEAADVFEIAPTGQLSTVLSGSYFASALDSAGDLFSTDFSNHDVYFLSADRTKSATYFSGLQQAPGIAVDHSGNLFVSDYHAGAVYERAAGSGAIRTVGNFELPSGVAVDAKGNLFVADNGLGTVSKLQLQAVDFGPANVCQASQGGPAPCSQSETLTFNIDSSGTFGAPVALTQGSPNLDFSVTANSCSGLLASGSTCTVTVQFAPTAAGARNGAIELTDASGSVLATAYVHGIGQGPQLAFSPGIQSTMVATGLEEASGVAIDGKGNLFVSDSELNQVIRITPSGSQTIIIGGLAGPEQIALDGAGNLFIPTRDNDQVIKVSAAGTILNTLGSGLNGPNSVAVDGAGNVYIADTLNNRIVEVMASTGAQLTLASDLQKPLGLAVDGSGNVFVADSYNQRVVKLPAGGGSETVIGTSPFPVALALDGAGNVFVADGNTDYLVEVPTGGGEQFKLLQAYSPRALALDAAGDLFIVNDGSSSVVELNRSQAPSFSFTATPVGSTSTDSPMSTQVQNIGNQQLNGTFTINSNNFFQTQGNGAVADCTGSFSLTAGQLCNVSIDFDPQATLSTPGSATFSDNSLNATNPFATQTINLNGTATLRTPNVGLIGSPNPDGNGTAVLQVTVTAMGNGPTPTGPVTFSQVGGGVVASSVLAPNSTSGSASFTTTTTQAFTGTQSFTAEYQGDLNYLPAASNSVQLSFTVNPTLTFSTPAAGANYAYGQSLNLSASSASSGAVTYQLLSGPAKVSTSGAVVVTGVGTVQVQANQTAAQGYNSASATTSFTTVTAKMTTTLTGSAQPGGTASLSASVAPATPGSYQVTLTGTVTFYAGSTQIGTVTLQPGQTSAVLTTSQTFTGNQSFTAQYGGNTNYASSQMSTALALNFVATTNLSFTFPMQNASYVYGQSFQTQVKTNSAATVSYTVSGAATVSATGLVTVTGVGPASVMASQAAISGYTGATATVHFTAAQASSKTALTATAIKFGYGTAAALAVNIQPQYSGMPTGSVSFYEDGRLLTTVTLTGGTAGYTTGQLAGGSHSFTASYSGDIDFTGSQSNTASLNVASASVMLRLASTNLTYPEPPLFDVIVAPASGKPEPTGTVSIYDGSTLISKSSLRAQSKGNDLGLVLPPLSVGQHTLSAVYSGDGNYAAGTSAPGVVTVHTAPVQLSLKCADTTLKLGQTLSCTVTAREAFLPVTGTVSYTVTGWGSGSVTLNREGQAMITYPAAAKGGFTLTASYAAQGDYQAAQPAKVNFTVNGIASTHTVGGMVRDLSGTVSLLDNGGNSLSISKNGAFTSSTAIKQGSTYNVSVGIQPVGWHL